MKLLFICTHNRCRSILSEAIANHFGQGQLIAKSAGSQPAGFVHPLSLKYLEQVGISTADLQSQSWDEFEDFEADAVITVCDSAAGESCPIWFGNSLKIHWGLADPSKLEDEKEAEAGFLKTIDIIKSRIETILTWDLAALSQEQLKEKMQNLATLGLDAA